MAEYFMHHGWNNITIAMPINLREIVKINGISSQIQLNLLVDSTFCIQVIQKKLHNNVDIWIEINAGYNRSGIQYGEIPAIKEIMKIAEKSKKTRFVGLLSPFGNSYSANNKQYVKKVYYESLNKILFTKNELENIVDKKLKISIGDTPSCSILEQFEQIDEIRPGNFVFYDLMQLKLGACSESDIAIALACPVISKNEKQNEIILYGGAVHLSKEYILSEDVKIFGGIVTINQNGWSNMVEDAYIKSLSQEHAVVYAPNSLLKSVKIGDLLGVIPVHSCLTANLMGKFLTTGGETIETERFR